MRQPLWILNSILLTLVILILIFMLMTRVTVYERVDIEPEIYPEKVSKEAPRIDIKKIYSDDIFDTYRPEIPVPKEPKYVGPLPLPPKPTKVEPWEATKPKFFDPLDITLKGIMTLSDSSDNTAIIEDNKTKRESVYKIGDMIEDAQLLRIFNNKVIFVRSNGQQEVFYLREKDAKNDPTFLNLDDWEGVVKKFAPNNYYVSPAMFAKRVKNLAQLIDILGLTSSYKKGRSIGCRIGEMQQDSLGLKLGLRMGDIILTVNNIPATTTSNRLKIYNDTISLKEGDIVVARLQRGRNTYTMKYTLKEFLPAKPKETVIAGAVISPEQIRQEKQTMMEQKYQLAPTEKELKMRERRNMFEKGGKPGRRRKYKIPE